MKKRDVSYEVIRVIAMIFILVLHEINTFMNKGTILYYVLATILLTGVPLFFMLSGKYAFNIDYNDKDYIEKYYKNKFINLIIPVLVYMAIKEFHVMGYNLHKEITTYSYIRALFVSIFNGYSYMEYWYLYILIANLLLAPFIGKWIIQANKKEATIFLSVIMVVNTISTCLGYIDLSFAVKYALASYGIYFYGGYFLDKFYNSKKEKRIIYILGILSFLITIILLINNKAINIWNYSPTYTFISFMMFLFIKDYIKIKKAEKVILFMGKYSLTIYMLHMIFIYTFNDLISKVSISIIIRAIIVIILTYITSLISGIILENTIIKWLKNIGNKLIPIRLAKKGKEI